MMGSQKVSNGRYIGIATSCFGVAGCLTLARSMLPGLEPAEPVVKKPDNQPSVRTAAQSFRAPQVLKIKPPKLVRSPYSAETICDFSDNGVILLLTSERSASTRTYELIQNGRRTPLNNISPDRPLALSPEGRPFQRPSFFPGRNGAPPVRAGQLGPGAIWTPAIAGSRYTRRYFEDGSYLVALPSKEGESTIHTIGRIKDGKFVETMLRVKDYQGILERTSENALWVVNGKLGRSSEMNLKLTRYEKGSTQSYPVPSKYTTINKLCEGNGVIAASMINLKAKEKELVYTFENGKWTPLSLPPGQQSARLTKVFNNGWILGETDDVERSIPLTILWKNKVPVILNDLPGWPQNGLSASVVGSARNGDIYVRNFVGSSFGAEEYYLIHLRE